MQIKRFTLQIPSKTRCCQRNADKEGHAADSIADALFRFVLGWRVRRREKAQTDSVSKLLTTIIDDKGEEAWNGFVITTDGGYGKDAFLDILNANGPSSILIMP